MHSHLRPAVVATLVLTSGISAAQGAPQTSTRAAVEPKVERFVHQDGYSRIEELRVGGLTRSIGVQTRSAVPGYEVRPIDPGLADERSGAGKRRWRVLDF